MQTRHTWRFAQLLVCQFKQLSKTHASHFSWFTLISAHSFTLLVTPYPPTQCETEHLTSSTVPWMMLLPSGIRMPPRMANNAPKTAPAISPHLLLQQPMVVCVSLRLIPTVRPSVCLAACSPSVSVFVKCAIMCSSSTGRLYHQRRWQSSRGQVKVQTPLAVTQGPLMKKVM